MLNPKAISFILLMCIGGSLINAGTFGEPSYFAYFLYAVSACIFSGYISLITLLSKQYKLILSLPVLFFLLFCLYVFLHGVLSGTFWLTHYYWLVNLLLFLSFDYLLTNLAINNILPTLFKGLLLFGILESIIVIFQSIHLLPAASKYFSITGTWVNPNVTAMFLAMVFPICLCHFFNASLKNKKLHALLILVLVGALILLKCRTALIGAVTASIIILNSRYHLWQSIKSNYKGLKFAAFLAIFIAVLFSCGYLFYKSKEESANGRKLVWKISAAMIAQKPITGYGYGNFEKNYNHSQAAYFATGNGTATEKANATFIYSAYNEILQNAIEGGIIGTTLFVLFFISLFFGSYRKIFSVNNEKVISHEIIAYTGITVFSIMSIFNFTIEAVPLLPVFIVYASVVSTKCATVKLPLTSMILKRCANAAFAAGCIVLVICYISIANAYANNKEISELIKEGKTKMAIIKLAHLESKLKNYDTYWINYGNALVREKKFDIALNKYLHAIDIKPLCETYILVAQCYRKLNKNDCAINACLTAKNITPNRMLPTFMLMRLFESMNDTANTLTQAKELINIQQKVESELSTFYKLKAEQIYKQFKAQ